MDLVFYGGEFMSNPTLNPNVLEFAVFCIENVAETLGVNGERVYTAFTKKSNILYEYIVPEYDVLHTQSREYIVQELLDVMKGQGVAA